MKDRDTGSRMAVECVEHLVGSPATVDCQYSSASLRSLIENMVEHAFLISPMWLCLGAPVQPDFPDIASFRKEGLKQGQFAYALVCKLRMEAERGSDSRSLLGDRQSSPPSLWRCCDGQYVSAGLTAF